MQTKSRGFTLVEVLVSLFILSIMAMLAWRGIDALLVSRDTAASHMDRSVRLQAVLLQWEQDLLAMQNAGFAVPELAFDGASLRITRRQPQGLQVVAWTVRDGRLYRWAGPIVQSVNDLRDSEQHSKQFVADDSQRIVALEGVVGWQMYYYRGNSWSNAQSSGGIASSSAAASAPAGLVLSPQQQLLLQQQQQQDDQQTPTGVRMVLEFDGSSGPSGRLTKTAMLGEQH